MKFSLNHFIFIILLIISNFIGATNYYISTTGNDLNNGLSIGNEKATLQDVINDFDLSIGDTVFIAVGTYSEKGIILEADDQSFVIQGAPLDVFGVPTSIFDSDQTGSWLTFSSDDNDNITIDNIKIKDFKSNLSTPNGGGIYINAKDCIGLTVSNCFFDNCDAGNGARGGAIFFLWGNSGGTINTFNLINSTFSDCDAPNGGGAVYINSGQEIDLKITKCKFYNNVTSNASGSVLYYNGPGSSLL